MKHRFFTPPVPQPEIKQKKVIPARLAVVIGLAIGSIIGGVAIWNNYFNR
jgi:hypothetical protein